ncbi:MAG: glutamate 5-kinase [Janthinobacterium lividum]
MIKVGTSTLTRGGGPPDTAYIGELAAQVAAQMALGRSVVLVSSGAIRAGMDKLKLPGRPRSIPQKQAAAAIGQGLLMHTYAEAFAAYDIPVAQILLTREDLQDRTRYLNACNTFDALLGHRVVPIVNENDTVSVDEIKFGDNDTLAALVASLIEADSLLLLSDVAGLYDRDPTKYPDAQFISSIETIDRALEQSVGGAQTTMGTGGMTTKIQAAKICANTGVRMYIADGRRPNVVADALDGLCGTQFCPKPTRLRSRQRWIAYGVVPKGIVTVNDGAKQRVITDGSSLLPAGVTHVSGHFAAGDLVRLVDTQGEIFAQGFVNYSHTQMTKIMGCRTDEILPRLGIKPSDEVIHRDNLVLDL